MPPKRDGDFELQLRADATGGGAGALRCERLVGAVESSDSPKRTDLGAA